MLVKVSQKYCGTFGIFNKDTNSVIQKDKTSAPFEMDDALAMRHIKNGILVNAYDPEEECVTMSEPEKSDDDPAEQEESAEMTEEDSLQELPPEAPGGIPEELPTDEEDLDSITDYKALKQMAKEAGINPFGKNKDELRAAIREANT